MKYVTELMHMDNEQCALNINIFYQCFRNLKSIQQVSNLFRMFNLLETIDLCKFSHDFLLSFNKIVSIYT